MEAIGKMRAMKGGDKSIVENSLVAASVSNVLLERAIQSVQGQIRVKKLAVEQKWKVKVSNHMEACRVSRGAWEVCGDYRC